jgi:hypothetical protein
VSDLLAAAAAAWAITMLWMGIADPHRLSRVVLYTAWVVCFAVARLARAEVRRRSGTTTSGRFVIGRPGRDSRSV